jgi:2'-5' RNA ligase
VRPSHAAGPHTRRLFFALWPGDPLRAALSEATAGALAGLEGQPVPPANLHVTLAFLGMVAGARLAELIAIGGADGPRPTVALHFDRTEFWARPKVLVALPAEVPESGRQLVRRLWDRLEALGFAREVRPWQPHLTLMRRIRRPPAQLPAFAPVLATDWRLALVESTTHPEGPRYRPLAEWPMT